MLKDPDPGQERLPEHIVVVQHFLVSGLISTSPRFLLAAASSLPRCVVSIFTAAIIVIFHGGIFPTAPLLLSTT